jgi:hypothetical protein
LLRDDSDIDSNDSVDMEDYNSRKVANEATKQEQHSYVDVLAHRLNEVD